MSIKMKTLRNIYCHEGEEHYTSNLVVYKCMPIFKDNSDPLRLPIADDLVGC